MSKALAQSGANVALMYLSSEKAHDTAAQISKDFNITCKAYKTDISNAKHVKKAIDKIYKDFGAIDVFVANAGTSAGGPSEVNFQLFIYLFIKILKQLCHFKIIVFRYEGMAKNHGR
jgi:short-subunit dehydrogenase